MSRTFDQQNTIDVTNGWAKKFGEEAGTLLTHWKRPPKWAKNLQGTLQQGSTELYGVVASLESEWPLSAPEPAPEPELPAWIEAPALRSNYGGPRLRTLGIIWHATRGGAQPGVEFDATINWFQNQNANVSAHVVFGVDGRRAIVVPHDHRAYHAGEHNAEWLGAEMEQPNIGDPISDLQYRAAREWVAEMQGIYGKLSHIEHKDSPQGLRNGKSDIGAPFDISLVIP